MLVIKIGERQRVLPGIDARQASATEHHADVVKQHIVGDPAPQQCHDRALAMAGGDAGAAELQYLARKGQQFRYVVFVDGIELAASVGGGAAQKAIGSHHAGRPGPNGVIDHQNMVTIFIEAIEIAAQPRHLGGRLGRHLLVEHAIAQGLGGANLRLAFRQAQFDIPGATRIDSA